MSIYIFHGDSSSTSRKLLHSALSIEKSRGHEIRVIEGDKLSPSDLESSLSTTSLFSVEALQIENLLSRLKSKDKEKCLNLIANYSGYKNIYLWDKKEVTPANLKKFPSAKVSLFKSPTSLFNLLDSLVPNNAQAILTHLHLVVKETEDIVVFTMIARQISYLIMMKSATSPKFAPWQMGKLRLQASKWDQTLLEQFIKELTNIDYKIKTGRSKLTYTDHLDILISSLLR